MILANHGLLTCGRDCAEAFSLMYSLELSCRAQLDALASGRPIKLPSPAICEHTARQFELYPLGARDLEWPGLMRMLDRIDPSYKD
jgi:ribulose-5-phosphate 4-epimerase/fuculose-1-phosphate aldolase